MGVPEVWHSFLCPLLVNACRTWPCRVYSGYAVSTAKKRARIAHPQFIIGLTHAKLGVLAVPAAPRACFGLSDPRRRIQPCRQTRPKVARMGWVCQPGWEDH